MEQKLFKYYIRSISIIKQQEQEPPLARPSVCEVNRNVMEYCHSFHSKLNTASPQTSRDDMRFCVWLILGILQAWVELYLVGKKPIKHHTCHRSRFSKTPFLSLKLLAVVAYTIWIATSFVIHFEDKILRNETKWGLMKNILSWNWPWGKNRAHQIKTKNRVFQVALSDRYSIWFYLFRTDGLSNEGKREMHSQPFLCS